jgi:hypothetical protein
MQESPPSSSLHGDRLIRLPIPAYRVPPIPLGTDLAARIVQPLPHRRYQWKTTLIVQNQSNSAVNRAYSKSEERIADRVLLQHRPLMLPPIILVGNLRYREKYR